MGPTDRQLSHIAKTMLLHKHCGPRCNPAKYIHATVMWLGSNYQHDQAAVARVIAGQLYEKFGCGYVAHEPATESPPPPKDYMMTGVVEVADGVQLRIDGLEQAFMPTQFQDKLEGYLVLFQAPFPIDQLWEEMRLTDPERYESMMALEGGR